MRVGEVRPLRVQKRLSVDYAIGHDAVTGFGENAVHGCHDVGEGDLFALDGMDVLAQEAKRQNREKLVLRELLHIVECVIAPVERRERQEHPSLIFPAAGQRRKLSAPVSTRGSHEGNILGGAE